MIKNEISLYDEKQWNLGCSQLSDVDPILKKIMESYPKKRMVTHRNALETLIRSIIGQQISIKAAKKIINMGAKSVLLKGGHLKNKMIFDILVSKKEIRIFPKRKIKTKHTHGTGCTLSSALATCLSQKKNMLKSCKISLEYVDRALLTAPGYGKGFGPLNHLVSFNLRKMNA